MAERKLTVTPERRAELMEQVDWARVREMTDAKIAQQNADDPDAVAFSDADFAAIRVQWVRKRSGLSQPAFARRFRIPVGTLRDWEQGKRRPDAAALAYLRVIERHPEAVMDALETT